MVTVSSSPKRCDSKRVLVNDQFFLNVFIKASCKPSRRVGNRSGYPDYFAVIWNHHELAKSFRRHHDNVFALLPSLEVINGES